MIARGHEVAPPHLALVESDGPSRPVSPLYKPMHDRLGALERLARLHAQGALTDEEFAAEKALILERHPEELILNEPLLPAESVPKPSLIDRLFGWRLIPVGCAAGLALSYAAQPQQTLRFFNDALRLFGA
jgi:hypothetical protein